ncbi:hypothetical protein [Paenibacillus paeoniae]|uniref:Uncharacterized protein n=1 Tax=Paenibacillus paeoniae TaxID=2292705 RepID=A0A371P5T6_9BACL|nr:hypothetical protein [Paenibacillus paeoniae]REK71272.1 hypothetical protein DX130_22795 [Paenibacillus paeoniae]
MELYFNDQFFSTGQTDIMDKEGMPAGMLDLESMWTSSVSVFAQNASLRCTGQFRFMGNTWEVSDAAGEERGTLRARFSLFSKRYEYDAGYRGIYMIESPAFSQDYAILDRNERTVATFQKISSWLQPGAFRLQNNASELDSYELVAVIMGVHSIQKRTNNNHNHTIHT